MNIISITEAKDILKRFYSEFLDIQRIRDISKDITLSFSPIVYDNFIVNGQRKSKKLCRKCGQFFDEGPDYTVLGVCPHCGNKANMMNYLREIEDTNQYVYILESNIDKGYLAFIIFNPAFKIKESSIEEQKDFDWMKGDFFVHRGLNMIYGIFIKNKGLRFFVNYKMLSINNPKNKFYKNQFYNAKLLNPYIAKDFFKTENIQSEISLYEKEVEEKEEKKRKKTNKVKKNPNQFYLDYVPETFDESLLFSTHNDRLSILRDEIGNKKVYLVTCPNCNKIHKAEVINNVIPTIYCKNCGEEILNNSEYLNSSSFININRFNVVRYELVKETNDLLIRVFFVEKKLSKENGYSETYSEIFRIFATSKKMYVFYKDRYSKKDTNFVKASIVNLDNSISYNPILMQSNDELKDIIEKSVFNKSGFIEACGLGVDKNLKICEPNTIGRSGYIYNWYKNPKVELVVKSGLKNCALDIMHKDAYIDNTKTNIYQLLNISKAVFKIARVINPSIPEIYRIQNLWELDNSLTVEKYQKIVVDRKNVNNFIELKKKYDISYDKTLNYLQSCYDYQCIEPTEAIVLWMDYLNMAKEMTYNLNNKNIKYPSSLKKEHDKATFAYRVVLDEKKKDLFHEASKLNDKYAYSYEDLFVKVPHEPEELIEEGINQKHCVASYVNAVRDRRTTVVFIRKKEEPNTSFYTVEIKDDKIVQVRGFTNKAPTEKNVLYFLQKWARYKNLELAY
jgi:hypothetical protein